MANPTWFDSAEYMASKLKQLESTEPGKWTAESLQKAFDDAGYTGAEGAFKHFNEYGMDENVSPSTLFDAGFYLAAKAQELEAEMPGSKWSADKVMAAIKAAGMNSAWEHFQMYGSQEGIATSAAFDAGEYIIQKTTLMNETKEGGRSDWSIAEVLAAFDTAGLNAIEHYELYGKAEFKTAGKDITDLIKPEGVTSDPNYDPYTGVQTYKTLAAALDAQTNGTLAEKYAISEVGAAGVITVAQQAGLQALLDGANPAVTGKPTYSLNDTMAAITGASGPVLMGSTDGYNITDTLANVAAGDDGLVNGAKVATAKIAFGPKAAVDSKPADVETTIVKFDDVDNKGANKITLVKADAAALGNAVIAINGDDSAPIGKTAAYDVDKAIKAFSTTDPLANLTYQFKASKGNDNLEIKTVNNLITLVDGGDGNDTFNFITASQTGTATFNGGADNDTFTFDTIALGTTATYDGGTGVNTLKIVGATGNDISAAHTSNFQVLDISDTSVAHAMTMTAAQYGALTTITTEGTDDKITFSDVAGTAAKPLNLLAFSVADKANYQLADGANVVKVADGATGAFTITGGTGIDTITVGKGGSTVTGGAGNDVITLGAGVDTIVISQATGGPGNNVTALNGMDTVSGFQTGAGGDKINVGDFLTKNQATNFNGTLTGTSAATAVDNTTYLLTYDGTIGSTAKDLHSLTATELLGEFFGNGKAFAEAQTADVEFGLIITDSAGNATFVMIDVNGNGNGTNININDMFTTLQLTGVEGTGFTAENFV